MEADTTVDFTKLVAMNIESKYMKRHIYRTKICTQNHILKLNQNWAPEKIPELINKIHKEIIQMANLLFQTQVLVQRNQNRKNG